MFIPRDVISIILFKRSETEITIVDETFWLVQIAVHESKSTYDLIVHLSV